MPLKEVPLTVPAKNACPLSVKVKISVLLLSSKTKVFAALPEFLILYLLSSFALKKSIKPLLGSFKAPVELVLPIVMSPALSIVNLGTPLVNNAICVLVSCEFAELKVILPLLLNPEIISKTAGPRIPPPTVISPVVVIASI